jgi:hypothetical protein
VAGFRQVLIVRMISEASPQRGARPLAVGLALLGLAWATAGCTGNPFAKESDFVRRMRQHDELREPGRADYQAELQESRRRQDEHAAHSSPR